MAGGRQDSDGRALRIIVLPPMRWKLVTDPGAGEPGTTLGPGSPRPFATITEEVINPHGRPWNPFSGRHHLFEGLDPIRALRVLLRERHCDAVLAVFESPTVLLLLLRRLFRFRPPVVMLDIGLSGGWRIRDRVLDFVVPRADAIIVFGRNQVEHIRRRWPAAKMVRFAYTRVDTDFFTPQPFVPDGPILTVGDDSSRDFPTLLTALDGLDYRLVAKTRQIAGDPPGVRVIRERLSEESYRALFNAARFVVVPLRPSVNAGGVSTLLEAMATGRALIVSESPGISDYVVPDVTALVVPPGDPAAMRVAIERLMRDDELCRRLAASAVCFATEHCSHAANAAQLAEVIHEVASR